MTTKFGCFHTVYENKKATEFILRNLESIILMHPIQSVVMEV